MAKEWKVVSRKFGTWKRNIRTAEADTGLEAMEKIREGYLKNNIKVVPMYAVQWKPNTKTQIIKETKVWYPKEYIKKWGEWD